MTTPEHVLAAISQLASSESKRPLLVCVDGFGGSGKSTLTGTIRHAPEVSAVVEGDDFYGPEDPDWAGFSPQEGYERFFDHERLAREVLRPLRRAEHTRYQRYDWQNNVLGDWVELPAEGVVVVEGVYMLRPPLREFWDLSIFVDTPWPVRLDRQVSRGENTEDDIRLWTDAEKYYERTFEPAASADLVLPGH
jgi:uridine kinase